MVRIVFLIVAVLVVYWLLGGRERRARALSAAWLRVALAVVSALIYLRSPIDLIPDRSLVGLLDDLLFAIAALWWALRQAPAPPPPPSTARGGNARWDPHAVLGVRPGASRDELTAAYRERMKQYHPDRVNGLGEELQRLAHEKTLEIQRAYEELGGRARR